MDNETILRNEQFYIRNFTLITNIQIILIIKIFISFRHNVSSDRSRFTLLNKYVNSGIWAIETFYLVKSVPCRLKTLTLHVLFFLYWIPRFYIVSYLLRLCSTKHYSKTSLVMSDSLNFHRT